MGKMAMNKIVRTTLSPISNNCEFKSILNKSGRFTYYFAFDMGAFYIVKHKNSFGFIPTYIELARFRYIDIYRYINAHYDANETEINDILKQDHYINNEVKLFLIKSLSECSWDELGINNFGNYGHDYLASGPDACRRAGMNYRLAELHEREQSGVSKSDLQPPWAYEKE